MHTSKTLFSVLFVSVLAVACGDDDAPANTSSSSSSGGGGGACNSLCTSSKFASGAESKFEKLTECQCSGTGGTVTKAACEGYCAPLGIPAEHALLSGTDKCACDGTSL